MQVVARIRVEASAVTCVKFAATGADVVCVHASGRCVCLVVCKCVCLWISWCIFVCVCHDRDRTVLWRWIKDRPTGVFSVAADVTCDV